MESSQIFLKVPQPLEPFLMTLILHQMTLMSGTLSVLSCTVSVSQPSRSVLLSLAAPDFCLHAREQRFCIHILATILSLPGLQFTFYSPQNVRFAKLLSCYFLVCLELLFDLFLFAFCSQLPEKIDIVWNNKMLRTAGLCTTGKLRYPKRERFAKIQISLKVCDSAGDGGSRVAPPPCFLPTPEGLLLGAGVLWLPVSQLSLSLLGGQVYCVLLGGHYYWMSHHH